MQARITAPLTRVWLLAITLFVVAAGISRALATQSATMASYWSGLLGLLAIGGALLVSWQRLAQPGRHAPTVWRLLRLCVVLGSLLWVVAMLFPFL
jgi:hypothetical protein